MEVIGSGSVSIPYQQNHGTEMSFPMSFVNLLNKILYILFYILEKQTH